MKLDKPTHNGEWEIAILTNLPAAVADAMKVAQLISETLDAGNPISGTD